MLYLNRASRTASLVKEPAATHSCEAPYGPFQRSLGPQGRVARFRRAGWICIFAAASSAAGCAQLPQVERPAVFERSAASRADRTSRHLSLARLHEKQDRLREAQSVYEGLLAASPDCIEARHRLAVVLMRLDEVDKANGHFIDALKQQPDNAELLTDFGYALYLGGDLPAAEKVFQRALARQPSHSRATNNLALVVGHQGRFDESFALFRRVVSEADANANLGFVHAQRGEGAMAAQRFSRALTLDSSLDAAQQALVQLADIEQRARQAREGREESDAVDATLVAEAAAPATEATPPAAKVATPAVAKVATPPVVELQSLTAAAGRAAPAPILTTVPGDEPARVTIEPAAFQPSRPRVVQTSAEIAQDAAGADQQPHADFELPVSVRPAGEIPVVISPLPTPAEAIRQHPIATKPVEAALRPVPMHETPSVANPIPAAMPPASTEPPVTRQTVAAEQPGRVRLN